MNAVPPWIMTTVVLSVGLVALGRWFFVNDTTIDHRINHALTWDLGALALYGLARSFGLDSLAWHLFACGSQMALANVYGLARLLDGADWQAAGQRQRRYNLAAVAVAAVYSLPSVPGIPIDPAVDWSGMAWSASSVGCTLCGVLLARTAVRDLRTADAPRREQLAYLALCVVGVYVIVACAVTAVRTAFGTRPGDPGAAWAAGAFLVLVFLAALAGVPLLKIFLARTELDRAGRHCRRLRRLHRDLTAVVPEVVLVQAGSARPESVSRLYRMTVEIRDALLHLKHYTTAVDEADTRSYARQIGLAARAKALGVRPIAQAGQSGTTAFAGADRSAELRSMLDLAREWPKAVAAASYQAGKPQPTAIALIGDPLPRM